MNHQIPSKDNKKWLLSRLTGYVLTKLQGTSFQNPSLKSIYMIPLGLIIAVTLLDPRISESLNFETPMPINVLSTSTTTEQQPVLTDCEKTANRNGCSANDLALEPTTDSTQN